MADVKVKLLFVLFGVHGSSVPGDVGAVANVKDAAAGQARLPDELSNLGWQAY